MTLSKLGFSETLSVVCQPIPKLENSTKKYKANILVETPFSSLDKLTITALERIPFAITARLYRAINSVSWIDEVPFWKLV
jgi:hypothetical protein